jgi:hypothetical protein
MKIRVPGAFASLLAQERDTLSCRAIVAISTAPRSQRHCLSAPDCPP